MIFFKPEDFPKVVLRCGQWRQKSTPELHAELANAKLERDAKVVYGEVYGWGHTYWSPYKTDCVEPTKQALLICIEPIVNCTHPKEKVKKEWVYSAGTTSDYFSCECGVKVKPKEFEEV